MSRDGNLLLHKLDEFIQKYYLNQLIRGALLTTGLLVAFFLTFAVLEYYGRFGVTARTIFFYALLVVSAVALTRWILSPAIHLWNIRPGISYDEAASIVGKHFSNIEDRLLNTLQLQRSAASSSSELLVASIDQRIGELQPIPFSTAIDLKQNRRFLRYALPPLFLLLLIMAVAPSLVTEGTRRIVNHRTPFESLAPFVFNVQNNELSTIELQDFELIVRLDGNEVPNDLYVTIGDKRVLMSRQNAATFSHVFRQPRESVEFQLTGGGYRSAGYELKVLPKPTIVDFEVALTYPSYLNRKNELRNNAGDLLLPEGTEVTWAFNTAKTDQVDLLMNEVVHRTDESENGRFRFAQRFQRSTNYTVVLSNQYLKGGDSLRYNITVVPDLHPSITAKSTTDSLNPKHVYFNGLAKDDHGFSALKFHWSRMSEEDKPEKHDQEINISLNARTQEFYHFWNMEEMDVRPGETITYYFEVWDNDGVNGPKSARTEEQTYRLATLEELTKESDAKSEQLKQEMSEAMKLAQQMQKEMEAARKELLNKKDLDWEDKEKLQDLIEKQKTLEKSLEQIKTQTEQKNAKMNKAMEFDPELVEKQQQLEKLFEEVMSEEMKELFEEMERLMDEMTKDKAQEMLEEMELSNEDLEKELDRSLEIFKQLEFEQKMEQTLAKLEQLAEDQEELSEDTKKGEKDTEKLSEEQEKMNERFEQIKEDMEELEKKNEELESPNAMEDMSEEQQQVDEQQQESQEKLEQKQQQKASDAQKNASDQMKKMAQKMGNMMMQMQAQGRQEDMEALRQIVENLLTLSFDQEGLIQNLKQTNHSDPRYTELTRSQQKLKDDSKLIEDSLFALSKRVPQLESVVNREIRSIKSNMKHSIKEMAERQTAQALTRQQFALTSLNNLALMLSETVEQMQQAMAQSAGKGSCSKPGQGKGGKPSAASMRKMQEQLNKQLEEMRKGMQEGGKEQGQKPGMKPGSRGMSKQLAKMAAQQEALRNMAREYESNMNQEGESGKGGSGEMKKLQELMEQTETDLVNKNITRETIMRQQEILTRLLEAETAEREREQEQRRESREAQEEDFSNPEIYFEYIRRKNNETELLRTVPPEMNPYYREKVDKYFKKQVE